MADNEKPKHNWGPAVVGGLADVPVGVASAAGGGMIAKKLFKGKGSELIAGVLAGGAAAAYADHLQRNAEKAHMSKVATEGNRYLEKLAEMTAEEQAALKRGYDRPSVREAWSGLKYGVAGSAAGAVAGAGLAAGAAYLGKGKPAAAAALGAGLGMNVGGVAGAIKGMFVGRSAAATNNAILDKLRGTHPEDVDAAILRDGKKSKIVGALGAANPFHGWADTNISNQRYSEAVQRLAAKGNQ